MTCPVCRKDIDMNAISLDYVKLGRVGNCPHCKRKIIFTRTIEHPSRGRPKHQSKKERLRLRKEAKEQASAPLPARER
jgi:hypothetical protein